MSRTTRTSTLQSHSAALANALGARNGAVLAAADTPDEEGKTSAELWLYGIVGGYWWGFNDSTVADQLRGLNVDHITVRLNSPGGDSIQGIAIGNLLRNHKATVTVVVDGLAASAASIIAIAGDDVVMSPGAQMMIHDPWFFTIGNAKELRQDADFLDKQGANMAGVYAREAGGSPESWRAAMTAEPDGTWYTADEAVEANLADRVGTVVAVSAAPEPPPVDLDDEDDDVAARAAWDLDVLISPAARAAWNVRVTAGPKPPTASADGTTQPEGAAVVDLNDTQIAALREQVGFAADADADTIVAAVTEALNECSEDTGDGVQIPEGMSLVDSNVLTALQADATAGREAHQTLATQERDREINAALAAGKIAATSRDQFVAAWDKDPTSTKAILDALTPGLVPIAEAGHESEPGALGEGIEITDAEMDAFASSLGLTKEALRG